LQIFLKISKRDKVKKITLKQSHGEIKNKINTVTPKHQAKFKGQVPQIKLPIFTETRT